MKLFNELETQYKLPSGLLHAVMKQESGGNTRAVSPKGARGAFQFMPATAAQYGVDVNDLTSSAKGAARMYADLLAQHGGDLPKALAGYNWGTGNVQRKGMDNMPAETRQYIQKVTANMQPQTANAKPQANPFDQFDEVEANPFDQFDEAPTAKPAKAAATAQDLPKLTEADRSKQLRQTDGNVLAGLVRGAGSIGSTLMYPFDKAMDVIKGNRFEANTKRRRGIDEGLQTMGAEPASIAYQGGKLTSEIAGTMGVGGVLGNGVRVISKAPQAAAFANALTTGGMRAGSTRGAANLATRVLGGGITGGTMAGMVDPKQAGTGALIGGALPPALMAAGKVGQGVGRVISGPAVAEPVRKAVEGARGAGYVIPPTQAKPTLVNRALEGFSGKITTAQNASARNQPVTNKLVAKALGLADDTPVSLDALKNIRTQAGQAYEAVGSTGVINTTPSYMTALDDIMAPAKKAAAGFPNAKPSPLIAEIESLKTAQFDASSAVAKIRELRNSADAAYRAGDKSLGKALKAGSAALEDAIEIHLKATNAPAGMLDGFREARQLIAKTYSVEKAMNATTGNVDAVKLGGQLAKGKPLSGGIRTAAEFGQQFPKAAQTVEKMGSLPQVSPLDFGALGTMSALTSNPMLMAGVMARPAARAAVLSPMVQNGLSRAPTHQLQGLLSNPELQQLLYRSAPVAATSR